MKKLNITLFLLALFFIPSIGIYFLHYCIFKDSEYLLKDFISQLAFLPIYYFFSTIIIDNILVRREKLKLKKNINMLIGVFFSEFGNDFIRYCSKFDTKFEQYSKNFKVSSTWNDSNYSKASKFVNNFDFEIDMHKSSLVEFKHFLLEKRTCLLVLLENNNLVEHDTFTDLLLAIFHLCEEFRYRDNFENLSENDSNHLAIDTKRAYSLIGQEWLNYSQHLKAEYPHLYSLSVSFNPFLYNQENASN